MYQKLIDWVENEIDESALNDFVSDGFESSNFLKNKRDLNYEDLYIVNEAEIEFLLEEEAIRLDLESSLEYTQEMSNVENFETVEEYHMHAFQQAVLIVARQKLEIHKS